MKRAPDVIIGNDYLRRWYIIPRNRWFNIYLHCFKRSDDDRALHDHPWWSLSVLLASDGELVEIEEQYQFPDTGEIFYSSGRRIRRFVPYLRSPRKIHRMVLMADEAWTLFITGPVVRNWGFDSVDGWMSHEQYLAKYGAESKRRNNEEANAHREAN